MFETLIYLIDRMPIFILSNWSLFYCLFYRSSYYAFLCTFRCFCFSFLYPYHNHKLDFCSSPCVFLGYSSSYLGYYCFDITSQWIYISHHVYFNKQVFSFDKFEQIATITNISSPYIESSHLPNLLYSLFFNFLTPIASLTPILSTIFTHL